MKLVVRPDPPIVDPTFQRMNGLQRAVESWCYGLLCWERWLSPNGDLREWLRQNVRVGTWLLIPALFVIPIAGLILWQLTGWVTILTSIAGKLIVLIVLAFIVIKVTVAFFKR